MIPRLCCSLTTLALAGVVAVGSVLVQPATSPSVAPVQPSGVPPAKDAPASAPPTGSGEKGKADKPAETSVPTYILDHKVKTIDGKDVDLSTYKGKVLVIVNVASRCGFTKQYEGLQELYEARKDQGLVVLGFPANEFGKQEPGSDAEIKEFCEGTFKVTFPMFAKIVVKGEGKHPLYEQLAAQKPPIGGEPRWNFTKFVVDREGNVVARFDAEKAYVGTAKLEPGLVKKVDELLTARK